MTETAEGLLSIDKPASLSSHDVVRQIRLLTDIRRVGHTGTLDPIATGVLVVCLGRATRLAEFVVGQQKEYVTTIRLGQETDTYDAEGQIVAEHEVQIAEADLVAALDQFRGSISQTPPMYSAVKQGGQPLYKQARQGKIVPRPPRQVTIYELELLSWRPPDVRLRVCCSTGTYIRSLAHDLGRVLGSGGHVTALRRTAVGEFGIAESVALADLTTQNWPGYLLPADTAVRHMPALELTEEEVRELRFGRQVVRRSSQPEALLARVYDPVGAFVGLVEAAADRWQPKKLFNPPGL